MTAKKTKSADGAQDEGLKDASFEQLVERVEANLAKLEGGELTLEQSLAAYEDGVKALRASYNILNAAEGKVKMLAGASLEDIDAEPELADYDAETGAAKSSAAASAPAKKSKDAGGGIFGG